MLNLFRSALVTGGTGFIGNALINRLLMDGVKVFSLSRRPLKAHHPNLAAITVESGLSGQLSSALKDILPDVVFNLAAAGVNLELRDASGLQEGNGGILTRLIQGLTSQPGLRLIHAGSCSEYGVVETGHKLSEDDPLGPQSLYGAAKTAAFLLGRIRARESAIHFVELRLFGVFGPGEAPHRLIPYLIHRLHRNEAVDLTGGEQVRDLLYIDDVISALITAGSESLLPGHGYNVCSGCPVKIRDIACMVADCMKKPHDLLHFGRRPYRADEPMWLVGDNRNFSNAAAWSPSIGLQEGIRRTVEAAIT